MLGKEGLNKERRTYEKKKTLEQRSLLFEK